MKNLKNYQKCYKFIYIIKNIIYNIYFFNLFQLENKVLRNQLSDLLRKENYNVIYFIIIINIYYFYFYCYICMLLIIKITYYYNKKLFIYLLLL